MKKMFSILTALCLMGCADQPKAGANQSTQKVRAIDENEKPPFIGMTKAEVIARYGQPKKKTMTDEGENWVYILNMGEFIGKHMIPFFYSETQLRTALFVFGPDGRLKRFNWDKPT